MRYIEWAVLFVISGLGIALANVVGFQVGFMESLPGVERAAVLPRRGPGGEVRGLTARVEGPARTETLRTELARLLAPCKCPGQWVRMDRIPLTPNGKCDRKRLEEMIQ